MIYQSSTASQCLGVLAYSTCSFHRAVLSHGKAEVPKAFLHAATSCKGLLTTDHLEVKF